MVTPHKQKVDGLMMMVLKAKNLSFSGLFLVIPVTHKSKGIRSKNLKYEHTSREGFPSGSWMLFVSFHQLK